MLSREDRKQVCKKCHTVIDDCEPMTPRGEFFHQGNFGDGTSNPCPNASRYFREGDPEIEPFLRKRARRAIKRNK